MKILDRYVAKNFLVGYLIAFMVLMGLCVVVDLFVNLDEFTENEQIGAADILKNVAIYYGVQSAIYFRNFAGMITVIAAVFSLGKMTRNNELVAVMASGVSLKRVIAPIVMLSILLTGLLVADQELIIPRLANRIIRSHDSIQGGESFDVWFMSDDQDSLICTQKFDSTPPETMINPTIIIREEAEAPVDFKMVGKIVATKAIYDHELKRWDLVDGVYTKLSRVEDELTADLQPKKVPYYQSNLTPLDIPIRRQEGFKSLLSSAQLSQMSKHSSQIKDLASLASQKNFRVTDPVMNIVMLMIALPVLVCRDPKTMKPAIMISFATTGACFIMTQMCKMIAAEVVFNHVWPELWAWAPIAIFLPIAVLQLDSMKT